MAIVNSSSRPSVVERILIDRLGQRGDGIADSFGGPIYVPAALPGEVVDSLEPDDPAHRYPCLRFDSRVTAITPKLEAKMDCGAKVPRLLHIPVKTELAFPKSARCFRGRAPPNIVI